MIEEFIHYLRGCLLIKDESRELLAKRSRRHVASPSETVGTDSIRAEYCFSWLKFLTVLPSHDLYLLHSIYVIFRNYLRIRRHLTGAFGEEILNEPTE